MAEHLFLTDRSIHTDITSLFMRADEPMRQQLVDGMHIMAGFLPEASPPSLEQHILQDRARNESFKSLKKLFEDKFESWDVRSFFEEAAMLDKSTVLRAAKELEMIAAGEIVPTSAQMKRLHNLSNNGLYPALIY